MTGWLQGKRALIVGAGSGIGRATLDAFHTEGARVAVCVTALRLPQWRSRRCRSGRIVDAFLNCAAARGGGIEIDASAK